LWDNAYTQVVDCPTWGDALLDVYLVWPESSFTSYSVVQGSSDHSGVLLVVEGTTEGRHVCICRHPHQCCVGVFMPSEQGWLQGCSWSAATLMGEVQRTWRGICSIKDMWSCKLLYSAYWLKAIVEQTNPIQKASVVKYAYRDH
jgi:hypothetical protein